MVGAAPTAYHRRLMPARLRLLLAALVVLASLAGLPSPASAAGSLDTGFGSGGIARGPDGSALGKAISLADGGLVAAGTQSPNQTPHALAARFSPSGALQITGVAPSLSAAPFSIGHAVAVQPDGKILVAGAATNALGARAGMLVLRFNSDGGIDSSFGQGGAAVALSSAEGEAFGVAVQPDGRIVLAGTAKMPSDGLPRVAIARFTPGGSPDSSFAGSGAAVVDLGRNSYAYGLALQPDGKLVVVGSQSNGFQVTDALVARFTSGGGLDGSFGSGGLLLRQYGVGAPYSAFRDVRIAPGGAIVAAGRTFEQVGPATFTRALFARFTPAGQTDGSFGSGGARLMPAGSHGANPDDDPGAEAVAIAGGGEVVGAGRSQASPADPMRLTLWALTPAGAPDGGFGGGGTVILPLDGSEAHGLAVQPAGRLVASGFDGGGGLLAAFTGFGPPPASGSGGTGGGGGSGGGGSGGGSGGAGGSGGGGSGQLPGLDPSAPGLRVDAGRRGRIAIGSSGRFSLLVRNSNAFAVSVGLSVRSAKPVAAAARKRIVTFAFKRFRLAAGQRTRVRLRLGRRGRALLRRQKRIRVTIRLSLRDGRGGRASSARTYTLLAGRSLLRARR